MGTEKDAAEEDSTNAREADLKKYNNQLDIFWNATINLINIILIN